MRVFKGKGKDLAGQNQYGLGLTEFHLGYLYSMYADVISADFASGDAAFKKKKTKLQISNKVDCKQKALAHFERASEIFTTYNHLKGMYLAKKHILKLFNDDNITSREKRAESSRQVNQLRDKY